MSIDYDRLRELVGEHTPGPWVRHPDQPRALCNLDTKFLVHHEMVKNRGMEPSAEDAANTELIALAPDMARELLHLLGVVEQQITHLEALLAAAEVTEHYGFAGPIQARVAELNHLLNGDTE